MTRSQKQRAPENKNYNYFFKRRVRNFKVFYCEGYVVLVRVCFNASINVRLRVSDNNYF